MKIPSLKLRAIFLIIALLAIALYRTPLLSLIENLAIRAISPIQKGFYNFGVNLGEKLSPFFIKKDLIKENEELRTKLIELYKENTELKLKEKDYQTLKTQLEFLEEKNYQYIFAQVIGKGSLSLDQILILNKGSKDGLKEGLPVIINNGVLIGKLVKVNENTSQVLLLLDNQSRVAAMIQPSMASPGSPAGRPAALAAGETLAAGGIIKGQYDLSLIMDLIPLDKKITPNDLVITSGLEPEVPAGLLIGTIKEVEAVPGQLFQKATVIPMSSFEGLRIVTIILNK